jgi:hypothetical protein
MRIDRIVETAVGHVLGRMFRRIMIAAIFALCAIAALYQFTAAGLQALQAPFGSLEARLIVGAVYAVAASIALAVFWINGLSKDVASAGKGVTAPRELQLIMLMEAVMLGYDLARKRYPLHRQND